MEVCLPNKVCFKVWLERALEMLKNGGNMSQFGWELTELPYLEEKKHIRPWPEHMETAHNIQKTYRKHIGNNHQWKRIYSDFILIFMLFVWVQNIFLCIKHMQKHTENIQKTNRKPEQIYSDFIPILSDFLRFYDCVGF